MAFACRPRLDRARRADHRARRHDAGPRARRRCATWPRRTASAALYVTHDLAVVANLADRVAVMYAGRRRRGGHRGRALRRPGAPVHPAPRRRDPDLIGQRRRWSASPAGPRRPAPGRPAARSRRAATMHVPECDDGVPPSCVALAPVHRVRCLRAVRGAGAAPRCTPATRSTRPRRSAPARCCSCRGVGVVQRRAGASTTSTFDVAAGRVRGARRRVGLGQVDARRVDRRAAPRVDRRASCSATRSWRPARAGAAGTRAGRSSTCSRTRTAR